MQNQFTIKQGLILFVAGFIVVAYLSLQAGSYLYFNEGAGASAVLDNLMAWSVQNPIGPFPNRDPLLLLGLFAYVVIALVFYLKHLEMRQRRPGVEHGSARWNTNLRQYNKTYSYPPGKPYAKKTPEWDNKNMILTNNIYLNMDTRATMRNNNQLVVGGSGSGKSRFMVKPNILQANSSYVITDPKGELLEATGAFLESQGYKVKVFNLVDMVHSNCYNPFQYIRDENGVLTMITALIKNTTPKGASSGDPFWEKSETALLQAICFYLYYEMPIEERNFANVSRLLEAGRLESEENPSPTPLDIIFEGLKERSPEHIAVRQYAIFKQAAGKTAMSILVSAAVRLTAFNLQSVKNLTSIDNIELGNLGDEKTALFCITPTADTTFNFLVALMYNQIFETLYHHAESNCKGRRLPIHVRFLLDEFANIGTIPEFEQKLATMRSYEISCTVIIQNIAQLKTIYKDNWESIVGNCDSFLFLGGQEQGTLDYVSKKIGQETVKVLNNSQSKGKNYSSSESYNFIKRELMTPDEIFRMNNNLCILFIRGLYPFKVPKYKYQNHPNYKETGDAKDSLIYDVKNIITPQYKIEDEAVAKAISLAKQENSIEEGDVASLSKMVGSTDVPPDGEAGLRETSYQGKELYQIQRCGTEELSKLFNLQGGESPEEITAQIGEQLEDVIAFEIPEEYESDFL